MEMIRLDHVTKSYGAQTVLNDFSLSIEAGEILTVIGRSGCGKTTMLKTINGLCRPDQGTVFVEGRDISGEDIIALRRRIGYVIQNKGLFPHMTVEKNITYVPVISGKKDKKTNHELACRLIDLVGLEESMLSRYPSELSGGQQQRVGIARALAVKPEFIVCDEPISALDVSIQSQVVNMLEDMQEELGLTYLFIAHDLSVVRHISNRIGVMYLGSLVELGESYELNRNPIHPYTKTLLSAVPVPDPKLSRSRSRIVLEGDIPSPINPPSGCRFHTRCPYATEKCRQEMPKFKEHAPGHWAACHLLDQ